MADSILEIHDYLEMKSELVLSSDLKKDCSKRGQEKVLEICKLLQADTYYNALGPMPIGLIAALPMLAAAVWLTLREMKQEEKN